jgi:phage terminase large subunit GpA-like protein
MQDQVEITQSDRDWLASQIESLTTEIEVLSPSEWAEEKRYLPAQVTPMPGYYRFDVTPYLREIVDCMGVESPVREVSLMKGVQLAYTTGVLENTIGYAIDHVKSAPVMMVTADADLAKMRMESYITPMLQHSELDHLIKSTDEGNARKTGKTDKKIEWAGGGFLIPFGAQNANKLRSFSIKYLLNDEIDAWPDRVGKDGDPLKLVRDRTAAFEDSRKILDGSTPLIKGTSKIEKRFLAGDQRYYFVHCVKCGEAQTLRWKRTSSNGVVSGITWKVDEETGNLIPGSVRYVCKNPDCAHEHTNDDKAPLLEGGFWKATAVATSPHHQSYHLSALYSPPGMQTWEACVRKWFEAWDVVRDRPLDLQALQVFYNNVLGEPYEVRGEKVRFESVSAHRRRDVYWYGEIPNTWAVRNTGSPILLLTCSVDVHADALHVAVFGWARDRRAFLIDYLKFEGDTEQKDNPDTWGKLRDLIETKQYTADDGKRYPLALTLIDSGYRTDTVYSFASDYEGAVYPVKGREMPPKGASDREFASLVSPMGTGAWGITVDRYKDRWSASLKHGWDGQSLQPEGHFNAPHDATDAQLKELTVEVKRQKIQKTTGKIEGFEWHRPSGSANELWDLLVYGNAALDLIAHSWCVEEREMPSVNWIAFYDYCLNERPYFSQP